MRRIDPVHIEELGRRAVRGIENLDRKKVGEIGRKAAKNLDPRRIEEIAEEAGRELLNVVERVADRVEQVVSAAGGRSQSGESRAASQPPSPSQSAKPSEGEAAPRKVRVEPSDD